MAIHNTRLKPNTEEVVSKVIDGEAVIINLSNGVYYSTDKVGAEIWTLVCEASSMAEIVKEITSRYDIDRSEVEKDVGQMLNQLVEENLALKTSSEDGKTSNEDGPEVSIKQTRSQKGVYEPPSLQVYRDMGDLLALDPPQPGLERTPWKNDGDGQSTEKTA